MWIVKIALQRPYTFLVLAILILLMGVLAILRTATDIFPAINIPVVATIWRYTGLQPEEMATRIALTNERIAQTTANDIEHTESVSLNGIAVVKYFFQPNADERLSYAQITAVSQSQLKNLPPGTTPPYVLAYNASTVPILQLALSSDEMSEAQIFDAANNIIRVALATVPGASVPYPYGGKQRQIQVDLNPEALRAKGLSGSDVTAAIAAQNLILPAGTQKIGDLEYYIGINASPTRVEELNDLPIAAKNGAVVYVRDVAHVRDGAPPQTNIARLAGRRAALLTVLKNGSSSTLDVISAIKDRLPQIHAVAPSLKIQPIGDQSIFVRGAISGVVREATIAACLTGLMILLFLGSWRSTLIIFVSIPLSILASIACLAALGETINIMTLGGLALAVGILVDDATVTIENINAHLEEGQEVEEAILNGAHQIALPALVSTLSICIVFVPMFMLAGIAKYLFVPLAEAVVFAMLASYLLSRTLIPTLSKYWLRKFAPHDPAPTPRGRTAPLAWLQQLQHGFEQRFLRVRDEYHRLLEAALRSGSRFALIFLGAMVASAILAFPLGRYLPGLGQDFFPAVDAGQIKLHMRARSGLRIEETAALCDAVESRVRRAIPTRELESIVDNIGLPYSGINTAYSTSAAVGPNDADIFISLKPDHQPTAHYEHLLRRTLAREFPSVTFAFLPADIVSQTLNFGIPTPLDVQVSGPNVTANRAYAEEVLRKLRTIPGAVDLRIQQSFDYPKLSVDVDRTRAQELGLTEQDVASNMLVSLSGSFQTSPSFWFDPGSGTEYSVVAQTPEPALTNINQLQTTPLTGGSGTLIRSAQILANVATIHRDVAAEVVNHYNAQTVLDIYGTAQGVDLGFIAAQVNRILD